MANPEVGKIYEVAINGVGYMLADDPQSDLQYRSMSAVLEPQRFADGATPVSEAIERYSFVNSSEWRGGAGQRFANRAQSDLSSYWDSQGIDPFSEDQRLKLLPAAFLAISNTNLGLQAVAGSNFILQGAAGCSTSTIAGDTVTTEDSYSTSTLLDIDIGYGRGFVARGTDLQQLTLGEAGFAQLSDLDVHRVAWIGDRLAVIYRDAATSTWRFSTIAVNTVGDVTAGDEEVPGGLLTLPGATSATHADCQFQLGGLAPGLGFVWFSGWTADGDEANVYVWGNDTTLSASIALQMPRGEVPLDLFFYQGGVYIYSVSPSANVAKIYRCVVNGDGTLSPFLLVDDAGPAPATLERRGRKFAADGRLVYFAWNAMDGTNGGLGVIDLATGGYAKRTQALASGDVNSVFVWANRPGMTVSNRGVYLERNTTLVASGWLKTSIFDADSALAKRWDSIALSVDPASGCDVDVEYTLDGGVSYTLALDAVTAAEATEELGGTSPSLGLRITLNGTGTVGPEVRVASVKFHPLGILDRVLQLPVNCSDQARGLNGAPLPYSKGSGMARARTLQGLLGLFVEVVDIDGTVDSMEVVQVDVRSLRAAQDPSTRTNRTDQVALVTLRSATELAALVTPADNAAPVLTNPGPRSGTVGTAITPLQLVATDANSDALVFGAVGLPPGLSCNRNGLITGTPTTAGAYPVAVSVLDGRTKDAETFTWTIT